MTKYLMSEDSGASQTIDAETIEEALEEAREWAAGGSYQERVVVGVSVIELDCDGQKTDNELSAEVEAGPEPTAPACTEGRDDHDWQSPHSIVGGDAQNPGVWGRGGTALRIEEVCALCGMYRTRYLAGSQRNPGDLPETISYADADERSLAWIASRA